jgi:hypothetical protein
MTDQGKREDSHVRSPLVLVCEEARMGSECTIGGG